MRTLTLLLMAAAGAPVSMMTRLSDQPVLTPSGHGFDAVGIYNPAAALLPGGRTAVLFRAQDEKGISSIGYAESSDGLHFTKNPEPVLKPEAPYEKDGGAEDPRLIQVDGTWYMTYTGYNTEDAQLCLATSKDLLHWQRQGVILPANKGRWNTHWTKSGAIYPEKINGRYWMYYMGDAPHAENQTGVAFSRDLLHWVDATEQPVLGLRPGRFDAKVVEPGPPPVMTPRGLLLIYNGADDHLVYRTGWALFDRNDPTKLIARSAEPFFRPEKEWELKGQVPNVVFVEGMVPAGAGKYRMYYGGADRATGVAEMELSKEP